MKECFKRVLRPTTSMIVTVTYSEDGRLSLVGKDYRHGSGQVYEYLTEETPAEGYTKKDCFRLKQAWKRWHLNDMRAGTPNQEDAVRMWRCTTDDQSYEAACKMLESINLLVDNGYKYGSAWLKEEVPLEVLEWFFSLPGDGATFEDIHPTEVSEDIFREVVFNYGVPNFSV